METDTRMTSGPVGVLQPKWPSVPLLHHAQATQAIALRLQSHLIPLEGMLTQDQFCGKEKLEHAIQSSIVELNASWNVGLALDPEMRGVAISRGNAKDDVDEKGNTLYFERWPCSERGNRILKLWLPWMPSDSTPNTLDYPEMFIATIAKHEGDADLVTIAANTQFKGRNYTIITIWGGGPSERQMGSVCLEGYLSASYEDVVYDLDRRSLLKWPEESTE